MPSIPTGNGIFFSKLFFSPLLDNPSRAKKGAEVVVVVAGFFRMGLKPWGLRVV